MYSARGKSKQLWLQQACTKFQLRNQKWVYQGCGYVNWEVCHGRGYVISGGCGLGP